MPQAKAVNRLWIFFWISLFIGLGLRLVCLNEMEYKEDEHINFLLSQNLSPHGSFFWLGMNSGVFIPNPGLSVWVYRFLALLSGATTAPSLTAALGIVGMIGILLCAWVFWKDQMKTRPQAFIWTSVLAILNPITLSYHRKLWPEAFLALFLAPLLWGYLRAHTKRGAFCFGAFAVLLGQVHMSGFFFAAALIGCSFFFQWFHPTQPLKRVAFAIGFFFGAIPLLPWLHFLLTHSPSGDVVAGLEEALQFKFLVFLITNPFGLHLGNLLGLHRGRHLDQLAVYFKEPILFGYSTYAVALGHLVLGALFLCFLGLLITYLYGLRGGLKRPSPRLQITLALFVGVTLLFSFAGTNVRRYYAMIGHPIECAALVQLFLSRVRSRSFKRAALSAWAISLLILSVGFLTFVHRHQGAPEGDFGQAFKYQTRPPATPNLDPTQGNYSVSR